MLDFEELGEWCLERHGVLVCLSQGGVSLGSGRSVVGSLLEGSGYRYCELYVMLKFKTNKQQIQKARS